MKKNESSFREDRLMSILEQIRDILLFQTKEVLTVKDFCLYTGFSQHYIYTLIGKKAITFYKPLGKTIFFKKEDVLDFLTTNQVDSKELLQSKASNYFINSKK